MSIANKSLLSDVIDLELSKRSSDESLTEVKEEKLFENELQVPKSRKLHKESCGSCPGHLATIKKVDSHEDSDSTEIETSTDEEERWKNLERAKAVPPEYYEIQKLVKFIKGGNQTATNIALCCMKDFDLKKTMNQCAVQDIGGVELLVNILATNDSKCRLGALNVLVDLTLNCDMRKTFVEYDGIPLLIDILNSWQKDLRTMAAETLANVARVSMANKYIRTGGGIPKLVGLLDIKLSILQTPRDNLSTDDLGAFYMAKAGATALWPCANSRHNREIMRKCGIVPFMARLIKSCHTDILIPIMGTIEKCASEVEFKLAIKTQGMIPYIVKHLNSDSLELKRESGSAISKCAYDQETRDIVRDAGGLEPLVATIKDITLRENTPLLISATAALWKCAISDLNAKKLGHLGAIQYLHSLLNEFSYDVLTNTVGAIAECVRIQNNRDTLRNINGIPALVGLLIESHAPLLENLARALKECAEDIPSMRILEDLDAVRKIWSLLNNDSPKVQACAAYAICPCVENAVNSGELVRSLVGAMEIVVGLLKSKDIFVLSAVCAAIATIAKDQTNLAILTDLKIIYKLAKLVHTTDDRLRETLAIAIAYCASFGNNTKELGSLRIVTPIVSYMASENPLVHRATAIALEKLSIDPENAITMHQSGVVPFLLEGAGSTNRELQLAAAGCLRNIRELALNVEEDLLKIEEH